MKETVSSILISVLAFTALSQTTTNSIDAKALLLKVQTSIMSAKTLRVSMREEMFGVKTETRFMAKRYAKDCLSYRQEVHAIVSGKDVQPFIQIMNKNKLYSFPTGCGDVIVRMKFMEQGKAGLIANLFLSGGKIDLLKDDEKKCSIRYICASNEVADLSKAMADQYGATFNKDLVPAIFEYKVDKVSKTLSELIFYSERGRLVKRATFYDWKFNSEMSDSNFQMPSKYKMYTANTKKEAERIQAELVKKALARQHGK